MTQEKYSTNTDTFISAFAFRNPFKDLPKQTKRKQRRPGLNMIATETPKKV